MEPITGDKLLSLAGEEMPMLWSPFLPRQGIVGIVGASESGKSLFMRQMLIAIVTGKMDFLGYRLTAQRSSGIILCSEDDKYSVANFLRRQSTGEDAGTLKDLHFVFDWDSNVVKLEALVGKLLPAVIVLDVWSDTFGGDPNKWSDVRQNLTKLRNISEKHECLVIIVHHTVKYAEKTLADKNKVNGSQSIEAKLRCVLELRNGEQANHSELRILKANYISREQKAQGILLQLDPETLLFSNTGDLISITGSIETGKNIYDVNLWVSRMAALKQDGLSYENARLQLVEEYEESKVPSLTWFKTRMKNYGGRSV